MIILKFIMLAFFGISIGFQINDPDGWAWALAYAFAAGVTLLSIGDRHTHLAWISALAYFAGFLWLTQYWSGPIFQVEEEREALGLLICAAWMLFLSFPLLRRKSQNVLT